MSYAKHFSTRATEQTSKIPGRVDQVENSAGGYVFAVDRWKQLDRFLILGNAGGSYYASEQKMTVENATCVLECAESDIARTVNRIVEVSVRGLAPKNDPAIFALAMLSKHPEALAALSEVCRIGTHLFQFVSDAKNFRGRGRAFNRAVAGWYLSKTPENAAFQIAKYQQRGGWSHRDILRLTKPKVSGPMSSVFGWAVGKKFDADIQIIKGFELAKKASSPLEAARLIREFRLPRECVPTNFLNSTDVWSVLLDGMPLTAMIRNLGKMTSIGMLKPMSREVGMVCDAIRSPEKIRLARVHPISILVAMKTYSQGHGDKGSLKWSPVQQVVDALDDCFYLSFDAVAPTGKRIMLACDVSGSMRMSSIAGTNIDCSVASGALAMAVARTEPKHLITAFTSSGWKKSGNIGMHRGYPAGIEEVKISPKSRLDDILRAMEALQMGGTDCALPMLYASEQKIPIDAFIILTDSETWAGNVHPVQALNLYRQTMGIPAKLIVVGMVANSFTIADPKDAGMLDVVGFSTDVPSVMSSFIRGDI